MRERAVRYAVVLALVVLFAACSSPGTVAQRSIIPTPTPSPSSTVLRSPSDRCGSPEAAGRALWFRAADGTMLDGVLVGSGPRGIILLHQYPDELCGWWPYAVSMARKGFHVLLFDFRCCGYSTCPRALRGRYLDDVKGAMSLMMSSGAKHVAIIGASLGGVVALMAGATLQPPADVVVSASGEPSLVYVSGTPPLDATAAVPHLRVPTLYLVSKDDRTVSVEDTQALYRATETAAKQIVVFDVSYGHGWTMFHGDDPAGTRPGLVVLAFLKKYLG
jgi:esterase/lipase